MILGFGAWGPPAQRPAKLQAFQQSALLVHYASAPKGSERKTKVQAGVLIGQKTMSAKIRDNLYPSVVARRDTGEWVLVDGTHANQEWAKRVRQ